LPETQIRCYDPVKLEEAMDQAQLETCCNTEDLTDEIDPSKDMMYLIEWWISGMRVRKCKICGKLFMGNGEKEH
jgi:hypothetical protein